MQLMKKEKAYAAGRGVSLYPSQLRKVEEMESAYNMTFSEVLRNAVDMLYEQYSEQVQQSQDVDAGLWDPYDTEDK